MIFFQKLFICLRNLDNNMFKIYLIHKRYIYILIIRLIIYFAIFILYIIYSGNDINNNGIIYIIFMKIIAK